MRLLPVLVIVAALFALVAAACSSDEPLQGTVLDGDEAPPFKLRNHLDVPKSLDDYTADVVLVSFLYTYCPDLCPAITGHLRTAHELLLDDATPVLCCNDTCKTTPPHHCTGGFVRLFRRNQ